MIDSYDVGTKLGPEDFSNDYYMPVGAYQYVEITNILGERVELTYVDEVGHLDDVVWVTKDQMARMLGWVADPLIGADDEEVAIYDSVMDAIIEDDVAVTDEELIGAIQNAPTLEEAENYEVLDVEDSGIVIEKDGERVVRAWVYSSVNKAREQFRRLI